MPRVIKGWPASARSNRLAVMARIHWHALRLWAKRIPFFHKPTPPIEDFTR